MGGGLDGKWSTVNDGQQCVVAVVEPCHIVGSHSHHPSSHFGAKGEARAKGRTETGNKRQNKRQTFDKASKKL